MSIHNKLASCVLVLCTGLLAHYPALAQGTPAFMNGGIGAAEQDAIKATARNYNLRLLFTQNNGEYISDVRLDIADADNHTVFTLPSAGPMTNIQLPAGKYKVAASYQGQTKIQPVAIVDGKASNLSFRWGGADQ